MAKYIVKTDIKNFLKEKDFCCSTNLPDKISDKVGELLARAVVRAESNGRKTVMEKDL